MLLTFGINSRAFLLRWTGIDRKVASGLVNRAVSMALGPIGSAIIVLKLSSETQGIYYLFLSILALRSFFELGIGMSITQIASHEKRLNNGPVTINVAFLIACRRWMRLASICFAFLVGWGGAIFLANKGYHEFSILGAWCLFVVVSALHFNFESNWSVLNGADYVKECNNLRLVLQLILYVCQWSLLLAGAGLFSFAVSGLVTYLMQRQLLRHRFPWLFQSEFGVAESAVQVQRDGLLQLVKRSGQTFLTGYFVFEIQQPICFHYLGAVGSAKLGFTQVIGAAIFSIPVIWIQSAFPSISSQVALGKVEMALARFKSLWCFVVVLTIGCWASSLCAIWILHTVPRFSERLLVPSDAAIFFAALGIQNIGLALTYWPRSFKVEPFVPVAYIQMLITPILLWLLVSTWNLRGVAFANLASWIIGLIGIALIARTFRGNSRVTQ